MTEHRFNQVAERYDQHARPQRALAERLLSSLPELSPASILEIGAGTGLLTRQLLDLFPTSEIVALDAAASMVRHGQSLFAGESRVTWLLGDICDYPEEVTHSLIVSNAALQWVDDLNAVIARLCGTLESGGYLGIGMMLSGTLAELRALRAAIAPQKMSSFSLPTWDEVVDVLRRSGLELVTTQHAFSPVDYENAGTMLRVLHEQGVTGGTGRNGYRPLTRGELEELIRRYDREHKCPDGVQATYENGVIIARKP